VEKFVHCAYIVYIVDEYFLAVYLSERNCWRGTAKDAGDDSYLNMVVCA